MIRINSPVKWETDRLHGPPDVIPREGHTSPMQLSGQESTAVHEKKLCAFESEREREIETEREREREHACVHR